MRTRLVGPDGAFPSVSDVDGDGDVDGDDIRAALDAKNRQASRTDTAGTSSGLSGTSGERSMGRTPSPTDVLSVTAGSKPSKSAKDSKGVRFNGGASDGKSPSGKNKGKGQGTAAKARKSTTPTSDASSTKASPSPSGRRSGGGFRNAQWISFGESYGLGALPKQLSKNPSPPRRPPPPPTFVPLPPPPHVSPLSALTSPIPATQGYAFGALSGPALGMSSNERLRQRIRELKLSDMERPPAPYYVPHATLAAAASPVPISPPPTRHPLAPVTGPPSSRSPSPTLTTRMPSPPPHHPRAGFATPTRPESRPVPRLPVRRDLERLTALTIERAQSADDLASYSLDHRSPPRMSPLARSPARSPTADRFDASFFGLVGRRGGGAPQSPPSRFRLTTPNTMPNSGTMAMRPSQSLPELMSAPREAVGIW